MSTTQQQQQIIVKAYYNDLHEREPEIRRFPLDISPDKDVYQTLETTIAQFNVEYPQGQFTLQYLDEDNDRITFSSNSELQSALKNNSTNGLIRIFVKPKTKPNATVHVGVICDGCQGSVIGNRYKCLECSNYDLCQTCSDKDLHPEHNMLKLTRVSHHHRRCGGPRFWHHFMRREQHPFGFQFPSFVNNWLSQFKGKELFELIQAHIPEHLRTEKLNEILNQLKNDEQADKPVDEKFLLENLSKILSSFGINCDYFANKQTDESKPQEKKEEEPTTASTESKPTSANLPPLGNLLEQLQTMFAPMFQPPTTVTANNPVDDQKKIDECVERMTSMGFVDSNGVLTELIKSKKGDLEQVLDALNPRNYKN